MINMYLHTVKILLMIQFRVVTVLLVLVSSFSCQSEEKPSSIFINLNNMGADQIEVFSIAKDIIHELSGTQDSLKLHLEEEIILDLYQGRYHSYIHIKPGEKVYVDTVSSIPLTLGVTGVPSKENKYLDDYWRINQESSYNYIIPELTHLPVDSFKQVILVKNKPLSDLIDKIHIDIDVSASFKKAMGNRYIATLSNDLSYYKDFQKYHGKEKPILPSDYYHLLESIEISDPSLLIFEEGRQIVSNYHAKDLQYEDGESRTEFYKTAIESAKQAYGNTLVAKYCEYELINKMVNFGDDLDESVGLAKEFTSEIGENYFESKVTDLIAPWEPLLRGALAPNFSATTNKGEEVKLSQLKGKKVYVDIWATWCGPCIAEIPALKQLENEFKNQDVTFVSVSIDEDKDIDKWKNFIVQNQLTGLQLLAKDDWNSELVTSYNIKGIPRFLLIDEEGNIISSNAPRPSDENVKKLLSN